MLLRRYILLQSCPSMTSNWSWMCIEELGFDLSSFVFWELLLWLDHFHVLLLRYLLCSDHVLLNLLWLLLETTLGLFHFFLLICHFYGCINSFRKDTLLFELFLCITLRFGLLSLFLLLLLRLSMSSFNMEFQLRVTDKFATASVEGA